jgi:cell division protein FtsX
LSLQVRAALKPVLLPEQLGLSINAVRDQLLAATRSGTAMMFGWLFVGFSFFLILAAALLISLFVRLRLEQRRSELGLYYALGFPAHVVRRLLLREGLVLAASGAGAGVAMGVGYAWLLIQAIRWGWGESLPSSFLRFHLRTWASPWGPMPSTNLGVGWLIGVVLSWMTIRLALRGWEKLAPISLLGGWRRPDDFSLRSRRRSSFVAITSGVGGLVVAFASQRVPPAQAPGLFFVAGFLVLVAGLAIVRGWLLERLTRRFSQLTDLALAQLCRQPRRGLLTVGLLASGVFLVLAVEAFRKSPQMERDRAGGTGGFPLVAESTVPLPWIPGDEKSWQRFVTDAMDSPDSPPPWPAQLDIIAFRLRPGDDVSCLNLYAPRQPRILGVPPAMVQRGGFSFILPPQASPEEQQNPWLLLDRPAQDAVPLLADDHTAQWILQKKIGDSWEIIDEAGRPCRVQLVGMLKSSLFQSELLIAERHFLRLFPNRTGYTFFLLDFPDSANRQVRELFADFLGEPFGLTLVSASERLSQFQTVENTYLSTFQVLGGLGLLFGVAGLAIVLVRNFQERLTEYALLVALGYSRRHLQRLAFVEQGILIGAGIAVGLIAAVVAVTPLWLSQAGSFPWRQIILLVTLLLLVGGVSGWAALRYVLRIPLLAALRRG